MQQLQKDVLLTFRMIWGKPLFFLIVVLTLAVGIGANTTIFSIVNSVVLQPLPYKDSHRIIVLYEERRGDRSRTWGRVANFLDWKEQNRVFEHLGHYKPLSFNWSREDGFDSIAGAATSANFFDVLGETAFYGRLFEPKDEQAGSEPVVILSYELWRDRFDADQSWVGRTITLDATPHKIVGVMPPGFRFSYQGEQDLWTARVFSEKERADRDHYLIMVIGRLKRGIDLAQAQADMDRVTHGLEELYPRFNEGVGLWLTPLKERIVGNADFTLLMLLSCVMVVLLISCINVINLLLAHTTIRERELALRVVLGAGRWRLVRHFLTECLVLSALGALGGLLLAVVSTKLLVLLDPGRIPRIDEVRIDIWALAFTLGVLLLVAMVLGFVTSFRALRLNLVGNLKREGVLATKEAGAFKVRSLIVTMEVALVLSLLVAGALTLESYRKLTKDDLGFARDGRFVFEVSLPASRYPAKEMVVTFFTRLEEKLSAIPGIDATATTTNVPLGGRLWVAVYMIEGVMPTDVRLPRALFDYVSKDYFQTMGIQLIKGRYFAETDVKGVQDVIILNESMATKHWTLEEAIGKFIYIDQDSFEVIGVVENAKYQTTAEVDPRPKFYRPNLQMDYDYPTRQVVVWSRTAEPEDLIPAIRNAVMEIDKDQPITKIRRFDDLVSAANAGHRFNMILFMTFGFIGLFLGAVGVYGVVSYSVDRRTREMGLRMAFGAQRGDLLRMILGTELIPVAVGLVLGAGAALALSRSMSSLLYEVSPSNPLYYAGVSCILLAVALVAIYIPALRASRVDPLSSIRYE